MAYFSDTKDTVGRFGPFIDEFQVFFKKNNLGYGAPRNVNRLVVKLSTDERFRRDFSALADSIVRREGSELSPNAFFTIVAIASGGVGIAGMGGAIGVPISALAAILESMGFATGNEDEAQAAPDLHNRLYHEQPGVVARAPEPRQPTGESRPLDLRPIDARGPDTRLPNERIADDRILNDRPERVGDRPGPVLPEPRFAELRAGRPVQDRPEARLEARPEDRPEARPEGRFGGPGPNSGANSGPMSGLPREEHVPLGEVRGGGQRWADADPAAAAKPFGRWKRTSDGTTVESAPPEQRAFPQRNPQREASPDPRPELRPGRIEDRLRDEARRNEDPRRSEEDLRGDQPRIRELRTDDLRREARLAEARLAEANALHPRPESRPDLRHPDLRPAEVRLDESAARLARIEPNIELALALNSETNSRLNLLNSVHDELHQSRAEMQDKLNRLSRQQGRILFFTLLTLLLLACAIAYLAYATYQREPANAPAASGASTPAAQSQVAPEDRSPPPASPPSASLDVIPTITNWGAALARGDVAAHMAYYADRVDPYFLMHNVTKAFIERDKHRFLGPDSKNLLRYVVHNISVTRQSQLEATAMLTKDWQTHSMSGSTRSRLTLHRFPDGWKITGEQDLQP